MCSIVFEVNFKALNEGFWFLVFFFLKSKSRAGPCSQSWNGLRESKNPWWGLLQGPSRTLFSCVTISTQHCTCTISEGVGTLTSKVPLDLACVPGASWWRASWSVRVPGTFMAWKPLTQRGNRVDFWISPGWLTTKLKHGTLGQTTHPFKRTDILLNVLLLYCHVCSSTFLFFPSGLNLVKEAFKRVNLFVSRPP